MLLLMILAVLGLTKQSGWKRLYTALGRKLFGFLKSILIADGICSLGSGWATGIGFEAFYRDY